jgi:hypothetical protein
MVPEPGLLVYASLFKIHLQSFCLTFEMFSAFVSNVLSLRSTRYRIWLKQYATSRKVAGLRSVEVIEFSQFI